jgi:hypothetical protein
MEYTQNYFLMRDAESYFYFSQGTDHGDFSRQLKSFAIAANEKAVGSVG